MIVFTGTGRSGTGLYAHLFGTHHEFRGDQLLAGIQALPGADAPATHLLDDPEVAGPLVDRYLDGVDLAAHRDSNNLLAYFIPSLFERVSGLRVVLGVRDGRDFARSGITRGYHLGGKYSGRTITPPADDPLHARWPELSPVERMAWLWAYRTRWALRGLEQIPSDRWLIVRLEDLTGPEGLVEIERLEDFLGVAADRTHLKTRHNANPRAGLPPKEDWPDRDLAAFDAIAGDLMRRFGYGPARVGPQPPPDECVPEANREVTKRARRRFRRVRDRARKIEIQALARRLPSWFLDGSEPAEIRRWVIREFRRGYHRDPELRRTLRDWVIGAFRELVDDDSDSREGSLEWLTATCERTRYEGHAGEPFFQDATWRGVPVLKSPVDLWIYQELVQLVQPDVVVQTGAALGGTTLFLADLLEAAGWGRIFALARHPDRIRSVVRGHPRVQVVERPLSEATIELDEACAGRRVLGVAGGTQSGPEALEVLRRLSRWVKRGDYLVCERTHLGGHPVRPDLRSSPRDAVEALLKEQPGRWEVDRSFERWGAISSPGGIIRRTTRG